MHKTTKPIPSMYGIFTYITQYMDCMGNNQTTHFSGKKKLPAKKHFFWESKMWIIRIDNNKTHLGHNEITPTFTKTAENMKSLSSSSSSRTWYLNKCATVTTPKKKHPTHDTGTVTDTVPWWPWTRGAKEGLKYHLPGRMVILDRSCM